MASKPDGKRKKFSTDLFSSYDSPARAAVMEYVSRNGLYIQQNDDKYGPDLVVFKGFKPHYYIEAEVKRVWKPEQDRFPWSTIQIPERKGKFLKLGKPIEFWVLREDLARAIIIPDFVISNSPLVEVKNKFIKEGELFFRIELVECDIVDLTEE
jgi:hypothetical protein